MRGSCRPRIKGVCSGSRIVGTLGWSGAGGKRQIARTAFPRNLVLVFRLTSRISASFGLMRFRNQSDEQTFDRRSL
jgi:hypothetical protein